MALRRHPSVLGEARFDSHLFSNVWRMSMRGEKIATFTRFPSLHLSRGRVGEATAEIHPAGWGTVVYEEDGTELGRIHRRSWWGRRWEVTGIGFACELVSEWRPRAWSLRIGGQRVAGIVGGSLSYNRLVVHTDISVPAWVLALAWQVVARPWEAAAAPRVLRPTPTPSS